MDLHEAYKILGVPENAGREEVEKQYDMWARKDRARKRSQTSRADDDFDFDRINEAYKTITRHFLEQEELGKPKRDPRVEKLDHFWTYYKWHVIGGIIAILVICYFANIVIERQEEKKRLAQLPPASVSMMLFGDYFQPDLAQIESFVLSQKTDWQRIVVNHTYVPSAIQTRYDYNSQQKAVITLISDRSDVYVINRFNFQNLVNQGLFRPLDEYADRLRAAVGEENLVYARKDPNGYERDEQAGELHLYTVRLPKRDVYNTRLDEILAGIHVASDNIENALQLIEVLAKMPQ